MPKLLPHEHELADVIRGVVGDEHQLPQVGLPGAVRNAGRQIYLRIGGQLLQRLPVGDEPRDARHPRQPLDGGAASAGQ